MKLKLIVSIAYEILRVYFSMQKDGPQMQSWGDYDAHGQVAVTALAVRALNPEHPETAVELFNAPIPGTETMSSDSTLAELRGQRLAGLTLFVQAVKALNEELPGELELPELPAIPSLVFSHDDEVGHEVFDDDGGYLGEREEE